MTDRTFPKQQYFSAEDCRTLYPPGTPYGNDHPNGWQDMADRLNALLASRLQAPTVVVPEPTSDEWRMIAENAGCADMADFLAGAEAYSLWLRRRARTVPDGRVLGEGMVAVDREWIEDAVEVAWSACKLIGKQAPIWEEKAKSVIRRDPVRANQRGAAT